jgi:serine/threonine protein kinase/Tfp pilus assembly protein PilF
MKFAGVTGPAGQEQDLAACQQCGLTSRVSRGFCLHCMLHRGLGEETYEEDTLERALNDVDVRDGDWRIGNYQILEEIGRGGMGVIYRARQRHSRRIVALKRILSHHADSRDTLVRFRREAEAAASLDHPNILPIYEVSEAEDGLPFFSMKFAAGGSLLESQAALRGDTRKAVTLMAKVARAVEYAHSRGILHRDLKPGNILLDGLGEPFVSDFGLAKWLDASSDLTRTLTIFGTPGYIAPEQANGPVSNLKATADIYSLGAILFDLLAGRPPFLGEHALSVIKQAAEKPAPKLRSIVPKIDRDLETVCARCLEREPNARYRSAADLAEDLERWLDGRPVVARPVSPPVRIWRWAHRNPKLAASVAGCGLAAGAALLFATFTFFPTVSPLVPANVPQKSVAVLPFQNRSEEKANAYFAEGIQDEILTRLSKIADLKVISHASTQHYQSAPENVRAIARDLGVAHVVEGSVQRSGDTVRVNVQLIKAANDSQIWADTFDRKLTDVFEIQSEIARKIADQLQAKISPSEKAEIEKAPTSDLMAFELYQEAKTLWGDVSDPVHAQTNLPRAARLLDQAVARDPGFLVAWCLLSRTHGAMYRIYDPTEPRRDLANAAAQAAIRLRPDAGEAHLALAIYYYQCFRDYQTARNELAIARRTLPNEAELFLYAGLVARRQGLWDEAEPSLKRSLELDPRNLFTLQQLALTYLGERRYPEEATVWNRVLEVAPADPTARVSRAAIVLHSRADIQEYRKTLAALIAENASTTPAAIAYPDYALCERNPAASAQFLTNYPPDGVPYYGVNVPLSYWEGIFARFAGDYSKAQPALNIARRKVQSVVDQQPNFAAALSLLGTIDAALGKREEALSEGRRACELLPISKDAIDGMLLAINLAQIYAWTDEKELAIDQIAAVESVPNELSYGLLKLSPYWDSLRGDPRFEKIVASLAPN